MTIFSSDFLPQWLQRWSSDAAPPLSEHIQATEITTVLDPIHENQRVEKSFTITKRKDEDRTSIYQLQVHAPGLTVIRVRPELVDEIGSDVIARVRVSSDEPEHIERLNLEHTVKNELEIKYNPRRGTVGHLVTEIDVPREGHVNQVIGVCRGAVVIQDGVLSSRASSETPTTQAITSVQSQMPTLMSARGSHLFLSAPQSALHLDTMGLVTFGSGSIHVQAQSLRIDNELTNVVLGRGSVSVETQYLNAHRLMVCALGGGRSSHTAWSGLHTCSLIAYQRGRGSVLVAAPSGVIGKPCELQDIVVGGGTVDFADVPSREAHIDIYRPKGGVVRVQSPLEKLTIEGKTHATIQYVGELTSNLSTVVALTEVSTDSLNKARVESQVTIPTIEAAFEKAMSLEKPTEGWVFPSVVPTLRSFFPF